MRFAIIRESMKFPSIAELIDPPPTVAELAIRAAVDIALIDARMTRLTYPDDDRPVIDCRTWPGFSRIISIR